MRIPWLKKAILPTLVAAAGFGYIGVQYEQQNTQKITSVSSDVEAQILTDYADKVVLPALHQFSDAVKSFNQHAQNLKQTPQAAQLQQVAQAWLDARRFWKLTSAYQFGPTIFYGLDKQISAWPVDHLYIEILLSQAARGELQITPEYLRDPMDSTLRGFHAAEYLLFREGKVRDINDLSEQEFIYIAAVTEAMLLDALTMKALWIGTDQLPQDEQQIISKVVPEVRLEKPYAQEFKLAGDSKQSRYINKRSAIQEIFQDSVELIEEMCPAITATYGSDDPKASETWYALNSQPDFLAQVSSALYAYMGGTASEKNHSIAEMVEKVNPVLAKRIEIGFADLAYRLDPLKDINSLTAEERDLATRIAYASCMKLEARMEVSMTMVLPEPTPYSGWVTQ